MNPNDPDRQDPQPEEGAKQNPGASRADPNERGMAQPYTGPENRRGITGRDLGSEEELRKAKEFAGMIVDTVREGLLILDLDLRVDTANESFYRMFSTSRDETEGCLIYELGNGQWDIPKLRDLLGAILPKNKVLNDFEVEHEFEDIGRRVMLLNARQLDDLRMILLAIEDVTVRRKSEHDLRVNEERYQFFIENAREYAIFLLDTEGHIVSWNRGAERVFGYAAEDIVGQPVAIIFTEEDRKADAPKRERKTAIGKGKAGDNRWHIRQDGTRFWATGALEALRSPDGRLLGFIKILRDNTERKETEEALRALNETLEQRVEKRTRQVRQLASTLTMAEQEERRRISQILHDNLQQLLYGIQMKLSFARQDAQAGEQQRLLDNLAEAFEWMDRAIQVTRHLTVDLSPPVLKSEGLVDALAWLVRQMRELYDLEVEVEAAHTFYIPDEDMRVLLFQVVRELLFNVVKHAETDHATVEINDSDSHLVICVTDEGRGFNVEEQEAQHEQEDGFGLFSVRERIGLFGGRLEIESAPGKGTRVTVHTPVVPQ